MPSCDPLPLALPPDGRLVDQAYTGEGEDERGADDMAGVDWLLRKSRCKPRAVVREGAEEGVAVADVAEDVAAAESRGS